MAANIEQFIFTIQDLEERLGVLRFSGSESISVPYQYQVEVVCENSELQLDGLLGKTGLLTLLDEDENTERYVHGVVNSAVLLDQGIHFTVYSFCIGPQLSLLDLRVNSRIFQFKSVPDIVKQLLAEAGIQADRYRWILQEEHPEREYCVQYQESELNFITRLLEDEGMIFYFEHSEDKHEIIFADGGAAQEDMPDPEVSFHDVSGMVQEDRQTVFELTPRHRLESGKISLRDYNFEKPALNLHVEGKADVDQQMEVYRFPGGYADQQRGQHLASIALQALRSHVQTVHGASACKRFKGGFRFKMVDHPNSDYELEYLLTSLSQQGEQPQVLEEGAPSMGSYYSNQWVAVPITTVYRSNVAENPPKIDGSQTALVVGPSAEEIYTNAYGQVKVQFHWDREGQYDEQSTRWLRVGQMWAGPGWGAIFTPRIAQEVIVNFVNGDVNQPIIVGRLYHGGNRPPYPLPKNKTKSTLKTNSSLGGDGFNELRFEDLKNQEQIFYHAERDIDERSEHDLKEWVGKDRHLVITQDQLERVNVDKHNRIDGDHSEKINSACSVELSQNRQEKTDSIWAHNAQAEIHLKAGSKTVIEASNELTIKAGSGFIRVDSAAVTVQGAMLKLNSGGSAGAGSGAQPEVPKQAIEAADDKPAAEPTFKPEQVVSYSPEALAMLNAANSGAAFVEVQ